ncbi:MAG: serine/threonine-protein kinase [Pseudanabaenaceae cyanobacterium bins.39]|nr:serine/threonine-protein kinase [Pseudanabaenaceae cyanobacterium bins.39]
MPAKVLDGRYKLIKQIGVGGFGHTFIARDMRRPGSPPCVVKQLKPASDDPHFIREARRLFSTEAETLEKLGRHDQIPQLLAYFEEEQQFFLVQEFIEGRSLHDELSSKKEADLSEAGSLENIDAPNRDRQLGELEVIKILQDVLEVLEFVHSEGVIHRDIKPDNLIRRKQDQRIVLIDFGAVRAMQDVNTKLTEDEQGQSRFTVTIGTPGYMPSEQCAGRPNYSSDIYALGMVAIKALTGYAPTDLPNDPATGEVVWRDKARVSNGLAMVLTRMVRYHYTQRYQSVREVKQGIQTFATMTEVERQATTSIRSTLLTNSPTNGKGLPVAGQSTDRDRQPSRRVVAKPPSSNSGVFILFGGLLLAMGGMAAVVLPALQNNSKPALVVTQPPVAIVPPTDSTPNQSQPQGQVVDQVVNIVPNQGMAEVSSNIAGKNLHTYRVQARAGQFLVANLTSNGAVMSVLNPQGNALAGSVNVTNTDLLIAADGLYAIQLRSPKNNDVAYQLRLGIRDSQSAPVPTTPSPSPAATVPAPPSPLAPVVTPSPTSTPTSTPSAAPAPKIEIKIRN